MMDHLAEPSSGTRRAALTLHALNGTDRAWLMRQLSPDQRDAMASLLAELDSLDIPRDSALIQDALASAPAPARATPPPVDLDAERLCRVLAREPDVEFQSLWLSVMDSSEQQAILKHWALPLEPRPRLPEGAVAWSATLRDAVRQSWLEAGREITP